MRILWPLMAAIGLGLFVSGLLPATAARMRARVEPYVGGEPRSGRPWARKERLTPLLQRVHRTGAAHRSPSHLFDRLTASGTGLSPESYVMEQLIWGFVTATAAAGALIAVSWFGGGVDLRALPLLVAIVFVVGFLGRDWWLTHQIERRAGRLRDDLPAAIDLITLSIMSGESVSAACARVSHIMPGGLGEEFELVNGDVREGVAIIQALERLGARVPEVGVGRFVDALCTGIEKGAPLADTLRAQADDAREARRRRLLEMGGRREVLMLIPVVFLIMPVVVVFALYPGLVTLDLLVY